MKTYKQIGSSNSKLLNVRALLSSSDEKKFADWILLTSFSLLTAPANNSHPDFSHKLPQRSEIQNMKASQKEERFRKWNFTKEFESDHKNFRKKTKAVHARKTPEPLLLQVFNDLSTPQSLFCQLAGTKFCLKNFKFSNFQTVKLHSP